MIDIAMIPMINKPMEGEAFDVQDHARRTGTSGPVHMGRWLARTSMGLKSPSDGCWDPISGRDRTVLWWAFAHEEKKDIPPRTLWQIPTQGGSPTSDATFSSWWTGRHLGELDVILSMWQCAEVIGTCGSLEDALEGPTYHFWMLDLPNRGQRLP